MRVRGDRRDPGEPVVEDRDVEAELLAERQDEPAEAGVDVQADARFDRDVGERTDRVDGAVAVVAGRPDDGHRLVVDVVGHPVDVDLGRRRVDRRPAELDAEQVARLVERRVRRLRLDQVGPGHAAGRRRVLAVGEDGVADAAGPARRDEAGAIVVDGLAVQQVERHRDDLGLELGGARAHVALEDVRVGEEPNASWRNR